MSDLLSHLPEIGFTFTDDMLEYVYMYFLVFKDHNEKPAEVDSTVASTVEDAEQSTENTKTEGMEVTEGEEIDQEAANKVKMGKSLKVKQDFRQIRVEPEFEQEDVKPLEPIGSSDDGQSDDGSQDESGGEEEEEEEVAESVEKEVTQIQETVTQKGRKVKHKVEPIVSDSQEADSTTNLDKPRKSSQKNVLKSKAESKLKAKTESKQSPKKVTGSLSAVKGTPTTKRKMKVSKLKSTSGTFVVTALSDGASTTPGPATTGKNCI